MIDTKKLHRFMQQISRERGPFTLFGLFLREDAPDKWDLVVSAPWLERGKLRALGKFVQELASAIGERQVMLLSRIVTLNEGDQALDAILSSVKVDDGLKEYSDSNLFGLPVQQAYVLRASRPKKPRRHPQS